MSSKVERICDWCGRVLEPDKHGNQCWMTVDVHTHEYKTEQYVTDGRKLNHRTRIDRQTLPDVCFDCLPDARGALRTAIAETIKERKLKLTGEEV